MKKQDTLLIIGNSNAEVGEGKEEIVVGPTGLDIRNIPGEK